MFVFTQFTHNSVLIFIWRTETKNCHTSANCHFYSRFLLVIFPLLLNSFCHVTYPCYCLSRVSGTTKVHTLRDWASLLASTGMTGCLAEAGREQVSYLSSKWMDISVKLACKMLHSSRDMTVYAKSIFFWAFIFLASNPSNVICLFSSPGIFLKALINTIFSTFHPVENEYEMLMHHW